jgi:hypothetical protein
VNGSRYEAMQHIYVLRGPSGAYVGCTQDPARRIRAHFNAARRSPGFSDQPLHAAMRADGADAWTSEIVAQARGLDAGTVVEFTLIAQLHAAGEHLFNEKPRVAETARRVARFHETAGAVHV